MSVWLRADTAVTVHVGPAVDKNNGVTPETGLTAGTVDELVIYKHEGTAAVDISGTTTFTHRAGGIYTATLSTTDTNTEGHLFLYVRDDSVCVPFWREFTVVPQQEWDSLILGTDALDVEVASMATDSISSAALSAAAVTEITDDIMAEVLTEPAQAIPPTTGVADVHDALRYLYFALTNRVDVDDTANFKEFYNRAESAVQWKKAISLAASIYTEDTGQAGP
jgi:hypothetical protein